MISGTHDLGAILDDLRAATIRLHAPASTSVLRAGRGTPETLRAIGAVAVRETVSCEDETEIGIAHLGPCDLASAQAAFDLLFCQDLTETTAENDLPDLLTGMLNAVQQNGTIIWCGCNRDVVEALNWRDAAHDYGEWRPDEAQAVLREAGFGMMAVTGHLLCRNGGTLLQPSDPVAPRVMLGLHRPADCLGWCIIARRVQAEASPRLGEAIATAMRAARGSRLRRFHTGCGQLAWDGSRHWYEAASGQDGALLFGPFAALPAGHHSAMLELRLLAPARTDGIVATIDAVAEGGYELYRHKLMPEAFDRDGVCRLPVSLPNPAPLRRFELRVFKHPGFALAVARDIEILAQ